MVKKEEEKNKVSYWWIVLGVIIGIALWSFLSGNFVNGKYKDCVDSCAMDESSCVMDFEDCVWSSYAYSQSRVGYVLSDDYEICEADLDSCSEDLEFCIDDCGN